MGVSALELRRRVLMAQPHKERKTGGIVSFRTHVPQVLGVSVPLSPAQAGTGDPYPPGGGVNIFDISTCHPSGAYGLTGEKNVETGEIRLHGTWTGNAMAAFRIIYDTDFPLTENAVYTAFDKNSDAEQHVTKLRAVSATIGGMVVQVTGMTNGNSYDMVFKPCVSIGTAPTEYAPYSNIRPISGHTGAAVCRTGKNLLDLSILRQGNFDSTASQSNVSFDEFLPIKGGLQYVWSTTIPNISGRYLRFYDTTKTMISTGVSLYGVGAKKFTAPQSACYFKAMWYRSGGLHPADITEDQIEPGATATEYAPYSGESFPFTFPETVYGGRLEPAAGRVVVEWASEQVLTGSDNGVTLGKELLAYRVPNKKPGLDNFISNLFVKANADINYSMGGRNATNVVEFRIALTDLGLTGEESSVVRLNAFKAWLVENPTYICYELADPVIVPLTPAEIRALMGENNVFADTGDVEVEFWTN